MNHAKVTVEQEGAAERALFEETLEGDAYRALRAGSGPYASVAMTVGKAVNYGRLKVASHVSLACDQDEPTLDKAGRKAFAKACQFLDAGFALLREEEGATWEDGA